MGPPRKQARAKIPSDLLTNRMFSCGAAGNRTRPKIAVTCRNAESDDAKRRETTADYAEGVDCINTASPLSGTRSRATLARNSPSGSMNLNPQMPPVGEHTPGPETPPPANISEVLLHSEAPIITTRLTAGLIARYIQPGPPSPSTANG
jgi:hypothetical protein